ncbi:membrane protein [Streptomyces rubradiris]|uniref:Membrane protein n=1 Tax=Streptomyces rubradiris TaxID=285531 RepID=A0ABQ3RLV2_STRRR|nr:membrane protein [Streptomyces eurythermus]GHI56775.1 membrane protein [Streptomyces rubradiris]
MVAVNVKKIAVYVLVVFALYVIITDPAKAADYVQIGFEGISDAAGAIGDFMTWAANGGKS